MAKKFVQKTRFMPPMEYPEPIKTIKCQSSEKGQKKGARENIGKNWRLKGAILHLKSNPKKWFSVIAQTPRVIRLIWEAIEYGYAVGKESKK